ncbi:lipoyl(octanoyl) transferase [Ranunculus cassubicifolius]
MRLQRTLEVWKLGMFNYLDALKLQQKLVSDRKLGKIPDTLLSLQHPPTYTLGKRKTYHNLLTSHIITYHGPHQAILYPIISLRGIGLGAQKYVENLEQVMIEFSSMYGVETRPGNKCETGVWVGDRKIGAIGVQISSGFTSHGLAYTIDPNMEYFKHIVPCGIKNKGVTSLKLETEKILPDDEVLHEELVSCFARMYGFDNVVQKEGAPILVENEE